MPQNPYFTKATFTFLKDLARNNNRPWFQENKGRYETDVRDPALRFISDFGPLLEKISPHFRADPRPSGGSLFRIYRDTRFAKDKTPYKEHTGIHFRHENAKDAYSPGFYLHLEPGSVFAGVGLWHPEPKVAGQIRDAIDEDRAGWKRAAHGKKFLARYRLEGDSLKRPPRGIDPEHPLIEDLVRKDFIGVAKLTQSETTEAGFLQNFARICRDGSPLAEFLCRAIRVPY